MGRKSPKAPKPTVFGRLRGYFAESLVKNSAFLIVNLGISAVSGYGAVVLLTRFFSVSAVGISAAAAGASSLVISITQSGINYSLPRFLPTSRHRNALINTLNTGVIIATAVGCIIFLATPFADKMFALGGFLFCVIFVVSSCLQAGTGVLGLVLIADRQSGKMVRANTIVNITRLAAPPAFKAAGNIGAFISRVISSLFSYILLARVLRRGGHRFKAELNTRALRELGRFSIGMSVATVIGGLPLMLLPIVVLSRLGAEQSAYWSIAIVIGNLLNSLPGTVTQALLPEVTHHPAQRKRLLIRSTYMVTGMIVPALILAYFAAPIVVGVLGGSYSAGMLPALHWLIFASFITMLNYASGAILFLAKKSTAITAVNVVDAIIVLGMAGAWATDARGVAISWFVGDVANTVCFGLFAFLALREVGFRFEDLGGPEVPSVAEPVRPVPAAYSVEQAFTVLGRMAEQQRPAAAEQQPDHAFTVLGRIAEEQRLAYVQQPYLDVTQPWGLYTALAIRESEREWAMRRAAEGGLDQTKMDLYGSDAGPAPGGYSHPGRHGGTRRGRGFDRDGEQRDYPGSSNRRR